MDDREEAEDIQMVVLYSSSSSSSSNRGKITEESRREAQRKRTDRVAGGLARQRNPLIRLVVANETFCSIELARISPIVAWRGVAWPGAVVRTPDIRYPSWLKSSSTRPPPPYRLSTCHPTVPK